MALSVSGFPESRHPATSNEVFTGESPQDGYSKATLMNSPRLRGLFGASNGPSKKPDPKNSPTSSKSDAEPDSSSVIPGTTPPTTPSLSFSSSSFEPLSQQEYELELQLPMTIPLDPPRPPSSKRPQLPPIPRKTTASPVRLGPNLARLDIGGGWPRSPPTSHSQPKLLPASVVAQEWGAKVADAPSSSSTNQSLQPRPLPSVPGNTGDLGKHTANAVAGPSRVVSAAVPIAGSSRHVSAVAGAFKQANAVAGSSKHPVALPSPPLPSPTTSSPASKVLITQPTPQRTHRQNSPSLSMRYQPLVAEPSSAPLIDAVNSATVSSPVRPLPRIPPTPGSSATTPAINLRTAPPLPSPYDPPPAKVKRPKTSPGPITGFSAPTSATFSRSWATRPVDLNPPASPLPISNGTKLPPRARSHSRPRRDRSLDAYSSNPRAPFRVSSPARTPANPAGSRPLRSQPSPTIGGARPLPKRSNTLDRLPPANKALHIQTSSVGLTFNGTSGSKVVCVSSGRRSQPPSPPIGPVKPRTKPSPMPSPTIPPPVPAPHTLPKLQIEAPKPPPTEPIISSPEDETITIEMHDAPLHSHPLEPFTDNESLLNPPVSPNTAESPIEVFVDDKDLSTISRGPSPMRYARPDSRGNLSESDEDDTPSSSSASSSRTGSPNKRRRTTQLRSYRNSYRPRGQDSPPHIPYRPRSKSPIPEQAQTPPEPGTERKKKKKKESRKARSYFGGTASGSAPGTRASSPERKSRSRQPRRLAEALTGALEEVRNRGRGGSSSPKRKLKPTGSAPGPSASSSVPAPAMEEMEVLDISLPSLSRRETTRTVDTASSVSDTNAAPQGTNSARSSTKVGWAKTIARKRSEPGDLSSTGSGSVAHLSSVVTGVELDGAETPYMWVSASKPPVSPAPFIPPPPPQPHHHHHRRMDSLGLEDYPLPNGARQQADTADTDKHGISCGLPLGGGKSRTVETTITSTVSVSRPPSSSTPFSGFSLTGRNSKKKRTTGSSVEDGFTLSIDRDPPLVIHKQQEGVEIDWMDDEKRSDEHPEEGDVVVVTTRRILRGFDQDGDVWEHEQETGVADIIPHLRSLKAKKG